MTRTHPQHAEQKGSDNI